MYNRKSSSSSSSMKPDAQRFKSEMFMPISQDSKSFEERQKNIWTAMQARMEQRRNDWNNEVANLRKDFFRLKAGEEQQGNTDSLLEKMSGKDLFYGNNETDDGNKMFRVSFDVSQFLPEEISVRTQEHRLIVNAKHVEKGTETNLVREFNRMVDLPPNIDPLKLQSTLSKDGILQIEAQMISTEYDTRGDSERVPCNTSQSSLRSQSSSPLCSSSTAMNKSRRHSVLSDTTNSQIIENNGSKIFRIVIDIGAEFHPSDLKVKTVDQKLLVHARHDEKSQGRTSYKEFNREFDLPDTVDPNLVIASMTGDGRLIIEAPIQSCRHDRNSFTVDYIH